MDIDAIVEYIHTLYTPHQERSVVVNTQQQLQQLQKQPYARDIAHGLLKVPNDPNVQFFGALTYTVYITNNENLIDTEFVDCLANEIVDACCNNLDLFVIQKLISTIGKTYSKTKYCPIDNILKRLSELNFDSNYLINFGLLLSKIYAEELNKWSGLTTEVNREIIDGLLDQTTKPLLNTAAGFLDTDDKLYSLWLECLQSWAIYLTRTEFDFSVTSDLNDYFAIIINLLGTKSDVEALNFMYDVFDTNPSMVNKENKQSVDTLIYSNWVFDFINSNDLEDNSKLSKFITLFLDTDMVNLAIKLIDPANDHKFEHLLNMTNQQGQPIVDETFSVDLLDFWLIFVEVFINDADRINEILNDENKINMLNEKAKNYFLQVSTIYWNKAHIIDEYEEYKDEFIRFRRDIGELFESLFSVARSEIFNNLVDLISTAFISDPINNINNADTSLYILNYIVAMLDLESADKPIIMHLNHLFDSGFLTIMPSIGNSQTNNHLYSNLIRDAIKFLSNINWFYQHETGSKYLKDILIFLFEYFKFSDYQESSSKAILSITDSCRTNLNELLDDFENTAHSMIVNKFEVELNVRSRIIRSYASILQTVDNPALQAEKVSNLLEVIYNESVNAYSSINSNHQNSDVLEQIDSYLLSMIGALIGLAKGLQLPNEWDDIFEENPTKFHAVYQYWKVDDNYQFKVHEKCLRLVLLFSFPTEYITGLDSMYNMKPEYLEQIYGFLKAGLSEPLPGPFVIEYNEIINYVIKCAQYCQSHTLKKSINSPMISVIEIYGSVIKANHISITISSAVKLPLAIDNLRVEEVVNEILFKQFEKTVNDLDTMQYIFTLFSEIIGKCPTELIQTDGFLRIIEVAIKQVEVNSQQRFVIQSLAKFWNNLIYLRKGKLGDVSKIQVLIAEQNVGEMLTLSLFKGFSSTSRSNVEFYIEMIRALTSKYGRYVDSWILHAFIRINSERSMKGLQGIPEDSVRMFVKKLVLTRGQRVANRLIQEFWFTVTGMVDYGI